MTRAIFLLAGALLWLQVMQSSGDDRASTDNVYTVVAFGDSTTAPRGQLKVFSQILQQELSLNSQTVKVVNAGVGGNTTDLGRRRFEADVLKHNPRIVIIQFGINDAAVDVWRDPPAVSPRVDLMSYTANLRHFVSVLKSQGSDVILMTPNPLAWTDRLRELYGKPPYDVNHSDGFNVLLKDYAGQVRELAEEQGVPLLDVYRMFEDAAGSATQDQQPGQVSQVADLLLDGMHPNEAGHRLIADALLAQISSQSGSEPAPEGPLIASITKETLWKNRDGESRTWFHPRACMIPGEDGQPEALMTLQEIGGSDYFGPVHWSISRDFGKTWSDPQPVPGLGREPVPGRTDGLMAGVCDVTPQYHPQSKTVIALGHVVFYKGEYFARNEQLARYPVYSVRHADGHWTPRKILTWDDPRGGHIYSNNCGQRVVLPNGDVQMSFTFGPEENHRMVSGVLTAFDGEDLMIKQVGPPLHNPKGRGLLEPSITEFRGRFWITMRAEDNRGYVSVSQDGLNWDEKRPWCWDDGTPLNLSTTQQHWLTHSDGLFLVYTRKDESNVNVLRWRSPLWIAQVDPDKRCLIKSTEQIVLPLVGDGVNDPDNVAIMGNFNVTNVSPEESWVTVGEWLPRAGYKGDVLLSRIKWSRPNQLPLW